MDEVVHLHDAAIKWRNDNHFVVTTHARERFVERSHKKFAHLKTCRASGCERCKSLTFDLRNAIEGHEQEIDTEILTRLSQASEERSYVNDTGFMQWYFEKYGYDQPPHFLVHENITFVYVMRRKMKVLVTCVPSKTHIVGRRAKRTKFKKVSTEQP
jgi:hypothetical protein